MSLFSLTVPGRARRSALATLATLAVLGAVTGTSQAAAAGRPGAAGAPVVQKGSNHEILSPDDFFLDLCGVTTTTTVDETYVLTTYPDGSQTFQTSRTFTPADKRLPIEKGAGTSWFDAAGNQTRLAGKPLQLISQTGGGVVVLDAGLIRFGDPTVLHGHIVVGPDNPDLARYYCPWAV